MLEFISDILFFQDIRSLANSLSSKSTYRDFFREFYPNLTQVTSDDSTRWTGFNTTIKSLIGHKEAVDDFNGRMPSKYRIQYKEEIFNIIDLYFPFFKRAYDAVRILESDLFGVIAVLPNLLSLIYIDSEEYGSCGMKFRKYIGKCLSENEDLLHPIKDAAQLLNIYEGNSFSIGTFTIDVDQGKKYIKSTMQKFGFINERAAVQQNDDLMARTAALSTGGKVPSDPLIILNSPNIKTTGSKIDVMEDLLNFWTGYPKIRACDKALSEAAMLILTTLVSSSSTERSFSMTGRLLTRDRLNLSKGLTEDQVIAQYYEKFAYQYI